MTDFHEFTLSSATFEALLALDEVADWRRDAEKLCQIGLSKASSVHTRTGDVVDVARRLSFGRAGKSERIFKFIEAEVLREFSAQLTGKLAVYRGHYDFVYYSTGGFFSKHVDHVNAYGPGLCCWHALVCLDAEACEGGATLVHSSVTHASSATVTPGSVLAIRNGVPHEGCMVKSGRKVLLKFEIFQFADASGSEESLSEELVPCECGDGVCHVERRLLLRRPFFERLVAFEGPRKDVRLGGFSVSECRVLQRFLAGDVALSENPGEIAMVHAVLEFISAPEASLSLAELSELCARDFVSTKDRRAARRLASLAGDEYRFFGVIQSWSVNVKDIWDLCLDLCSTDMFLSDVCVVSSGSIVMTTSRGPRWHPEKPSGFIELKEMRTDVHIFGPVSSLGTRDTFETMDVLLKEQVCASSADHWEIEETKAEVVEEMKVGASSPLPASLSVVDGAKLARLLVRHTSRSDFKQILESCVGMARFRREVVEDACNDGESFFTTTLYESRVYQFEWLLAKKSFLGINLETP